MERVERAKGATDSERFLRTLADQTFLDLWSYPNVFGESGKEICDLLVVCGEHVIIFSDKSVGWQDGDLKVAWPRWYKRAIGKSVAQIRGAERWLRLHRTEIYLDAKCTKRLPLELPPADRSIVHGICVAFGAESACRAYCDDEDGTFIILPGLIGDDHIKVGKAGHFPFAIGDVDPTGPFVHVFDQESLTTVMFELDTIADFTRYLTQRAQLIRSKALLISPSEVELLANYMLTTGPDGHCFPKPDDFTVVDSKIAYCQGEYAAFKRSPGYAAMRSQRRVSRIWDKLIQAYTGPVLMGTTQAALGIEPSIALSERALRFMALEPRMARVVLGQGIEGALREFLRRGTDRFTRILFPGDPSATPGLAYIFMILEYPRIEPDIGYERYRQKRIEMLQTYCFATLQRHPEIKTAVGIAIDAPGSRGSSEDMIVIENQDWSDDLRKSITERCKIFGIFESNRQSAHTISINEYPE